jgi:hypothetical protein
MLRASASASSAVNGMPPVGAPLRNVRMTAWISACRPMPHARHCALQTTAACWIALGTRRGLGAATASRVGSTARVSLRHGNPILWQTRGADSSRRAGVADRLSLFPVFVGFETALKTFQPTHRRRHGGPRRWCGAVWPQPRADGLVVPASLPTVLGRSRRGRARA